MNVRGAVDDAGVVEVEDGAEHGRGDSVGNLVLSPGIDFNNMKKDSFVNGARNLTSSSGGSRSRS